MKRDMKLEKDEESQAIVVIYDQIYSQLVEDIRAVREERSVISCREAYNMLEIVEKAFNLKESFHGVRIDPLRKITSVLQEMILDSQID